MTRLNLSVRAFSSPAQPFFSSPSVLLRSEALLFYFDMFLSGGRLLLLLVPSDGRLLLLLVPSVHPTQVTLLAFEETFYLNFFMCFYAMVFEMRNVRRRFVFVSISCGIYSCDL